MQSKEHFYLSGREAMARGPLALDSNSEISMRDLQTIGINLMAMDTALTGPAATGGNIRGHFLEAVLPGMVRLLTRVRTIDEITGMMNIGNWYDDQILQNVADSVGKAELYGDTTNIPLASYKQTLERRNIQRFEQGFMVGKLEEARQSAGGYDATAEKRRSAIESLEISRNRIGFYGFGAPNSRTYGLLNDPSLAAYETATTSWLGAAFSVITGDIQAMFDDLELRSGGNIKDDTQLVMVLPTGYRGVLATANTSARGETVRQWIEENFPNVRFVFAPEFVGANGGANVAYLFAESVDGGDGEGGRTLVQLVPTKYQVLGSENRIKGYIEDATNATAGVMVLRPWAVTRITGI